MFTCYAVSILKVSVTSANLSYTMPHEQLSEDPLAMRFITIAQYILILVFGLLPVFFVPSPIAPLAYSKVLFVVLGLSLAIILYGFALLRGGTITLRLSWPPIALWFIALIALISSLLSGDLLDTLIGETFEVHTTLFVALMALTASAWMLLGTNKAVLMRFFMLLAISTLVLSVFHILRLVLGTEGVLFTFFGGNQTFSPFGGWNDLAIFFGLAVMLSLVALEQLRLTNVGQLLFGLVVAVALIMLAVINFFAVWIVLGLVSLSLLIYGLTKDRFSNRLASETKPALGVVSIGVSLAVLIASLVFILGGSMTGNAIARLTSISYMEVRPSLRATTDIVKQVYDSEVFFGVGPNRFSDTWRQFKDPAINESIFWNTDFVAGFGYIPTFFATIGLVGSIAWIAFLVLFVVVGIRMLVCSTTSDRLWYFIGTTSFVGGLYIWVMSIVYVPGPVLLLTAALCTGLMSAAYSTLMHTGMHEIRTRGNRRIGFVVLVVFLVFVLGSGSVLYVIGRHYASVYVFNSSFPLITTGASLDTIEAKTIEAYSLWGSDAYARQLAEYQIARLRSLLSMTEPTEEQKQQFTVALESAINAAKLAVAGDVTDPRNVNMLGTVYATLVPAKIEGAYERSVESLMKARELDPHNPLPLLTHAQLAFAAGREDEARTHIEQAINMKSNYSDAIFFLAQMDIAAGNTDAAITASKAITVFEPQNPVRFFQLGVLFFSTSKHAEAVAALEQAVALNGEYANARFYLALAYDALDRAEDARIQLDAILVSNPGNELVLNLLGRLDRGEALLDAQAANAPIPEASSVKEENGSVTASETPDTSLVSPVNTSGEMQTE